MYIYSEKTKKRYDTVEECEAAEREFEVAIAEEKERKEKLATERKDRAKEVEEAFKKAHALLNDFAKDYGSFHFSYGTENNPLSWLDLFW